MSDRADGYRQLSFFDWISTKTEKPALSGYYFVKDRYGREFKTWFEKCRGDFNHVFEGVGYSILFWRRI